MSASSPTGNKYAHTRTHCESRQPCALLRLPEQFDSTAHCVTAFASLHCFCLKVVTSFDDMNLQEELLRGIYAYGFEKPLAIQQRGYDEMTSTAPAHASTPAISQCRSP